MRSPDTDFRLSQAVLVLSGKLNRHHPGVKMKFIRSRTNASHLGCLAALLSLQGENELPIDKTHSTRQGPSGPGRITIHLHFIRRLISIKSYDGLASQPG